ncbi:phospholipid transport system substrate-binding protein [Nitrosospira sp. Nsp14]|jgi:phospholipid transport system substrate-binding protein|uniref:MlaC/ttg2D family ABC transporter substrate-binding protein n=1 Tax=Nitrosospira sp. Nsp14 TaxID=1855333 RepID=UPI0008E60C8E|nr:ABC transporter substrate-binding protein [Nitrosospira sp. Nsp14]SFH38108.1 phospholipid transport system substrate-binding protein [Nitrosospira sp. Nsp14]
MKKYLGIPLMLLAWLLAIPAWAIAETNPDTLVDNTAQEVLAIVRQDKDIQGGNKAKILDLVEAKILPHFNFNRMTRLAMGKNWSKAAPEQQQELVKEFRTLLVRTYSNALSNYSDATIKVEPLKSKGGETDTTVKTRVIQEQGQEPVPIDYSMEKTGDGWKVYDVTVAGVSLVTNYRSTFNNQVREGGVEKLIKTLADKNRSLIASDKKAALAQ